MELGTGIPLVAMTANIMTGDIDIYKKSGMSDYVGKPFTSQELWRCLMKYLTPVDIYIEDNAQSLDRDNELRQKLINRFVKTNRGILGKITEAIKASDIKLAHRLVHTLKSNAGQLKLVALQQAAEDMESRLHSGENQATPVQLENLKTELDAAIAELEPMVTEATQSIKAEAPSSVAVCKLFEKLKPLLSDGDSDCLMLVEELRSIPGCEELIRQMEDLDLTSALETLEDMM